MSEEKLPPRWLLFLIEAFFRSDRLDEIYGDLVETFNDDVERMPLWKAKWRFFFGSLLFFKPSNHRTMTNTTLMLIGSYLKIGIRSLRKNKIYGAINVAGLAIGLAVVFVAVSWINYHRSFDDFHSSGEHIYEVMTNSATGTGEIQTYRGAIYKVMEEAKNTIPEIGSITRIVQNWRWPSEQCLKIDDDKPCVYEKGLFTDASFFEIFDFEILHGSANPLTQPKSIVLSESVAKQLPLYKFTVTMIN